MTAAAAEGFAFQRVIPLLFVGLGKAELAGLHGIKYGFLDDGRVMVGDDVPRFSVLQAASGAAYFENRPLADHIHAGVAFVLQNAENGGRTPDAMTAGNIVCVIASRRFVLAGRGDASAEQLPRIAVALIPSAASWKMSCTTAAASGSGSILPSALLR